MTLLRLKGCAGQAEDKGQKTEKLFYLDRYNSNKFRRYEK
jgi:hypothetical protein